MQKILFFGTVIASLLLSNIALGDRVKPDFVQKNTIKNVSPNVSIQQGASNKSDENHTILANILLGGISGIISGIISTGIFWYFLYRKKPIIAISSKLVQIFDARTNLPLLHEEKPVYAIKIINLTRTEIINIKLELAAAVVIEQSTKINASGQSVSVPSIALEKIQIGRHQPISELMMIDKFDENDSEAKYAQQLVIAEEIVNKCNSPSSFLLLRIVATHATSGFSKVYEQRFDYPLTNFIVSGRFKGGESLEVQEIRQN